MRDSNPRGRGDESRADRASNPSIRTDRRRVLSALGAGVAASAGMSRLAGASAIEDQYGTVVDIVDAGADNTGNESITPVLREVRGDDTLVKFPPGEYYMDEQFRLTGFSNFGMVGDDATLVPADYHDFDGPQYRLFRLGVYYRPGRDLRVENFTVDQTAADTGIRVIEGVVSDGMIVRDVDVVGTHDSGTWGPGFFTVTDPDGSAIVERFSATDGGAWVGDTPNDGNLWRGPSGIIVTRDHEGQLEFRDCSLGGFPDNGLYAVTNGTVVVDGGRYENSNAASIRVGGQDCAVRNVTVVVDENPDHFTNQRGIRLEHGGRHRVENIEISLDRPNGHAISVQNDVDSARIDGGTVLVGKAVNHGIVISADAGPTDVVGTDINVAGGGNAIQINGSDAGRVVCERVTVTGNASGHDWRHAIRCDRNDCEIRACDVEQSGDGLRRAVVLNGDDCLIYDTKLRSSHHPVIVNGGNAWIEANYIDSYDGYEAIRLNDSSYGVKIKNNTLVDGILDKGSANSSIYGNTY